MSLHTFERDLVSNYKFYNTPEYAAILLLDNSNAEINELYMLVDVVKSGGYPYWWATYAAYPVVGP